MEQIAAFMLLVGCNSNASSCTEIPVPVPAYDSVADCQDNLQLQIRLSGSQAQKVLGTCTGVRPEDFEQSATIDWAVSRQGDLMVSFEPETETQMVASREATPQIVASR